ncbi:TIGR01906 family membrane protein [Tersicoccus sp. MR15.9]|uniref:TIGR01906 family membrane protein n=1 Tax=Tersicoccus mangrovi TaxID=3121635 RepID=UPI002FE60B30
MSSRTPRPEDENPPLDTDDGDRYIPTSRELAEQYRRERSQQETPAGDRGEADRAQADSTGAGSRSAWDDQRGDDVHGDSHGDQARGDRLDDEQDDLGRPDELRDDQPLGRDRPGNADLGPELQADGTGHAGVRVTEPVALVPDETATAGHGMAGQNAAANGTAVNGTAANDAHQVDPADRAVPSSEAPGAESSAGATGDGDGRWRDRFDHAAAMDDWDREFGGDSTATSAVDGAEPADQHNGPQDADRHAVDHDSTDQHVAGPDASDEHRADASAAPAVGTGITETDARTDAGRAAPGATTIDRRTAATQPDSESVPPPLGAAAVAAGDDVAGSRADTATGAEPSAAGYAGADDQAADRLGDRRTDRFGDSSNDRFGDSDRDVDGDAADRIDTDERTDRDRADPTGADRDALDGDRVDSARRDDDRHTGAGVIGATAAGAALAGGAVAAGAHRHETDTTAQPVTAPVRDGGLDRRADGLPRDRATDDRTAEPPVADRDTADRDNVAPTTGARVDESDVGGRDTVAAADLDDDEARRRADRRDAALEGKPAAGRFWQVVLAIAFPVVLLVAAIRAVASPLFLWIEYHRPGFPVDTYGYTTDDRLTFGSAVEDYINNFANPRYLTQIPGKDGGSLLTEGEVSHMVDVKNLVGITYIAAAVLAVLGLIAVIYLAKRYLGGVRRGLFAGSVITLVVIIVLGVLAVIDWSMFFTTFHRVLFSQGNWTFYENDALIRLFPSQFWVDSGIVIGGIVLIVSVVTLIMTWPTRRRRDRSRAAQEALRRSMAEHEGSLVA